jgi:putative membrane-bound dehydrogenase-like protein
MFQFVRTLVVIVALPALASAQETGRIRILFFGDKSGHAPEARFHQLEPVMRERGIDITFTDTINALNPKTLAGYDGLIIYTNTLKISPEQEKTLLDFVESGKGFIPLHCASFAFLNSPKYIALVGAQFKSHGTGVFRTTIAEPNHPIMKGYQGFESWDETYVHTKHNEKDRIVLEYREDGKRKEPWTWVRTQGKGRVFYTAWGHDQRTWSNAGFQDLVERGIRWAVGRDPVPAKGAKGAPSAFDRPFAVPEMAALPRDLKPFEYKDVGNQIPNYRGNKGGKQGATLNLQQLPLPAGESLRHLVTPKGLKVELVAADPDIYRPICMNWDEQGRLWIAETLDYPHHIQPSGSGQGNDRLVICEDTKSTGRMDKFTVFADKLSIPASFTFSKGGVIVFEGYKTVFLKDTTGEGKANVRREMFGTWAQGDTHGGASNMRYGLDNFIWAMQGYNRSAVTVGGETHRFSQGFFRFKPDGSKLEFLRSTNNNTWGLGISEDGLIFGSTANANPSVAMVIPNRYYEAVRGWKVPFDRTGGNISGNPFFKTVTDKVRQVDNFGHYTAAAGHALYTARNYPPEYWNRAAFVTEPTGHLVGTFVITREGARFKSSNPFNLLASDDEWTSPIMAEVGPDGNVWVIDWYSYIVQHNPTPPGFKTGRGAAYLTDLRKSQFGRIYKIVPENAKPRPAMTLKGATPDKLVATLANDNMFWRLHAQRLLVERGQQDVVPALVKLVQDPSVDPIGLNVGAIHALWTLHGLGAISSGNSDAARAVYAALKHPSPSVRRNAVQVLPRTELASANALLSAGLLDDPDPHTRLAAFLALADLKPTVKLGEALVEALTRPSNYADKLLLDAATSAAANNSQHFLMGLASRKSVNDSVLNAAVTVAEHYARGGPVDTVGQVVARMADAETSIAEPIVRGLAKGWPGKVRPRLDDALDRSLAKLATRVSTAQRASVVKLATAWGSKSFQNALAEIARALLAQVRNEKASIADRLRAANELLEQRPADAETAKAILEQITPRSNPELARGFLTALEECEAPEVGQLLIAQLPGLTPEVRGEAIRLILSRSDWTRNYLESVGQGKLSLTELSLDQKQALSAHPNQQIRKTAVALLKKSGVLPSADREAVIKGLLAITREKGDVAAGKLVFTNICAKCHRHSGVGTAIGPDLTGMAVHTKEHLLTEILDPSRSVEANYRVYTVVTGKGLVLNGLLAAESKTAIELYDVDGKKQTILRDDIENLVASPKSLMPDGFEKQLDRKQLTDLLEFLTHRDKYLPLVLDKAATIVTTRGMFYSEDSPGERLVFRDWGLKKVGEVPFVLVDPRDGRFPNAIMLYSPNGQTAARMPRSVSLACNSPARAIHLLSGVSGWGYPYSEKGTVSAIVRLHYEDGKTEDHPLKNGEHFADYIRKVDVPGSQYAFNLMGKQLRYLAIHPQRRDKIERIEFVKGPDQTAPIFMAVTLENLD